MKGIDPSTPVVVLKFHHGSLGIVRSLGRLGVAVYAVHAKTEDPSLASRYCRGRFAWPIERAPASESISFLREIGQRLGRRAILLPTSDQTTLLVAEHASALRESFLFPDQDPGLLRSLVSKKEMHGLSRSLDLPTARTQFPASRREVEELPEGTEFPLMLKAIDGARLEARTGVKMVIVRNRSELLEQYERLEDPEQPNLMIQEYIPGGDGSVWMFNGYFDASSTCLVGFTGRKIRQNPVYTGATSLGICLANEEVDRTTREFMKRVGYRGILDIGYRYDARDGSYKVLDVNPRVGQTFRLFVGEGEVDVVRALYLDLTGQPVPATRLREGRRWVVEDKDLESFLHYRRDGRITALEWLRSFRGVEEFAWFSTDDLRPFWRMVKVLAARILRWVGRRGRPAAQGVPGPSAQGSRR